MVRPSFQDVSFGPQMVIVPSGSYYMGSPEDEIMRDRQRSESPLTLVTIDTPFAIARHSITVSEFTTFVDEAGHPMPDFLMTGDDDDWRERPGRSFRNPGHPQTGTHPVVGVNWHDAQAYVSWLSAETGRRYRLPTEAEWEYAARAGSQTPYWWGKTICCEQANYNATYVYENASPGIYRAGTLSVDSFAPNPFGLYQVHGNVWEWCEDCWAPSHEGTPKNGAPHRGNDSSIRCLRGGSWLNGPWVLRAAKRIGDPADFRHNSFGFRIAADLR